MSYWIPFLGYRVLDAEIIDELGLDRSWRWEGLILEWMGSGIVLWARPVEVLP